jgi:hypothetical protein
VIFSASIPLDGGLWSPADYTADLFTAGAQQFMPLPARAASCLQVNRLDDLDADDLNALGAMLARDTLAGHA